MEGVPRRGLHMRLALPWDGVQVPAYERARMWTRLKAGKKVNTELNDQTLVHT